MIERSSSTRNSLNEKVETWHEIGREFAAVLFGLGAERREAAQTQSSQAATFQVPDNALTRDLTARDRIAWQSAIWDIAAPGRSVVAGELEIVATAAVI